MKHSLLVRVVGVCSGFTILPHRSPGLTANRLTERSVQRTLQEGFEVPEAAAGDQWAVDCYRDGGSCGTIPEHISL